MSANTEIQCARLLAELQKKPVTTLYARDEMFIMSPASRVYDLKAKGHVIVTHRVPAVHGSRKKIAQYTLLAGSSANGE